MHGVCASLVESGASEDAGSRSRTHVAFRASARHEPRGAMAGMVHDIRLSRKFIESLVKMLAIVGG